MGALSVKRGVKQGSVLSPTLFILFINPLLQQLEASGLGLTINSFYAGGFAHADDIRTLATTVQTLEVQLCLVRQFYAANFLQVNVQKCEVIVFDRYRGRAEMGDDLEVEGVAIPSCSEARCLGSWWRRDLFATRAVEEEISKARRAVFQFGSVGTFQGVLNPASSKSVIETCLMPALLYGCENWILIERLINQLNSFVGELAKRCLRWPKHHSNTAALVALDLESIRWRLLLTKLGFLRRSMLNDAGVGAEMIRVMSESLCLVKECRELEEGFGTYFTDELLSGADSVDFRHVRKEIRR